MQYVGRAIGSVSKTWSSINPATLSGAIDVIVVEQPDGSLACSPFHVRFGKFQILKPSQKRVEVLVNGKSTNIPMKLSDSGEAYFVFETYSDVGGIPSDLIGSPVSSAPNSPEMMPIHGVEPDEDISLGPNKDDTEQDHDHEHRTPTKNKTFQTNLNKRLTQIHISSKVDNNGDILLDMEGYMPNKSTIHDTDLQLKQLLKEELGSDTDINKFIKEDNNGSIRIVNPYEHLTSSGLSEAQVNGIISPSSNIISMSEPALSGDQDQSTSEYNESILSGESSSVASTESPKKEKLNTDLPETEGYTEEQEEPHLNYIKTLRLTSDQLRCLNLKYGENDLSYSIDQGKAIVTSKLFVWKWDVPIVISDIDGTITKSDALGHVLAMIGKDWTHAGVAKLFSEISRNGYNIMYLTARSAGQSDSTRSYLRSINQDGNKLPLGPVILSPDRTMAALRREVILKKPEVFKIACLNDIRSLYFNTNGQDETEENEEKPTPFFAGFGNRITDALSYRTVGIPSSRIFTINTEGEVHMELLELAGYKSSYLHINELVDHFFPPVFPANDDRGSVTSSPGSPVNDSIDNIEPSSTYEAKSLYIRNRGEKFTDANFWREPLISIDDLSDMSDDYEDDKKGGLVFSSSPNLKDKIKDNSPNALKNNSLQSSPSKSFERRASMDPATTPDKLKSKDEVGKQMYLTLGSPLNSPLLSSIDTTDFDNDMRRLSISKPPLPTSSISKVNVLDDVHSVHEKSTSQEENNNTEDENYGYEDEFDDDEFDEDEFVD